MLLPFVQQLCGSVGGSQRACGAFRVGAVLFSNQHGPLGETKTAKELMQEWQN